MERENINKSKVQKPSYSSSKIVFVHLKHLYTIYIVRSGQMYIKNRKIVN